MDGNILKDNLKRKGLDDIWLGKELKKQGYKSAKEVFLGICDDKNNMVIYGMK